MTMQSPMNREERQMFAAWDTDQKLAYQNFRMQLSRVFFTLNIMHILAYENFRDCRTCGAYDLHHALQSYRGKGIHLSGYAFYDEQANEFTRMMHRNVYLSYSSAIDPLHDIRVGHIISDAFRVAGFQVVWDGSSERPIRVEFR